ncbi:hypothetical protein BJY52DRAFT_1237897 [Lactarius psammicola]|nr:hypothetical protein BJY52DRAFT_1237897 [Lactarius psammicola]
MTYVPPTSFYDIFPNDFVNWNFAPPVGNIAGGAPAGTPRYGFQYPGVGVPTLIPSTAPAFQAPAPVERTSSAGSSAALSTFSSQPTPSGSSAPSPQDLAQLSQFQGLSLPVSADAPPAVKRRTKRTGPPRRRGPNKRRPGSGYVDMMSGLPEEVQNALQQEYANCCEVVRGKDPSTVQKHRFTKRHFNKVDPKYQPQLPAFTCPAYVGLHDKCKNAKAGRYDSTERHCNNCPGFADLRANSQADTVYPFTISKEEFDAVQNPAKKSVPPALVEAVILRLITMLTGATRLPEPASSSESQPAGDGPEDASPAEEQPSPSPSPADPSPSAQPQQPEQPLPVEPIYNATGDDGAVSQVAAASSWLDTVGTFPPGLLLQPPYGLYPSPENAGPSTWPDMNYDPATFGTFFDE